MVGDLIQLLQQCDQLIEPNLQQLADEYNAFSNNASGSSSEWQGGCTEEEDQGEV